MWSSHPTSRHRDHFGLAVDDYAHSTAPNRRFADLVTQRLLKAALAGRPLPMQTTSCPPLRARCTEREDAANRVERQVRKAAAAMLLAPRRGEVFDAVVTGASNKGTWVRLRRPMARAGSSAVPRASKSAIASVSGSVHTDPRKGFIDFEKI